MDTVYTMQQEKGVLTLLFQSVANSEQMKKAANIKDAQHFWEPVLNASFHP